jgi:hypothetical protein
MPETNAEEDRDLRLILNLMTGMCDKHDVAEYEPTQPEASVQAPEPMQDESQMSVTDLIKRNFRAVTGGEI